MATQKLSTAHEAAFYEREGLLIRETLGGDESVALTRKEVAALRALIAPPVTDEQIDELIHSMFAGLYQFEEIELEPMRQIVRDWLTTLNQTSQTGKGAKE